MDDQKINNNAPGLAWALITTGGLRLICRVVPSTIPGDIINTEALEYRVVGFPVQTAPGAPPGIMWKAECVTLHNCRENSWNRIRAKVDSIVFVNDMAQGDREMLERQVKTVEDSIRLMKLQRDTGITVPGR